MPLKDRMILSSAPRFALAWVISEVRRSAIGLAMTGVVRLVRPVRVAPWFRFGQAIQKGKASPQHGANRISSYVSDFAQAEIPDIATGAMLNLSIGGVLIRRRALRRQA